jgi:hypothetical protein
MWEFLHGDRWTKRPEAGFRVRKVEAPLRQPMRHEVLLPEIVKMTQAGSGIDLIARALLTSAYAVHDALHLHRTGQHQPRRIDKRRRRQRQPGQPFVPKYERIAADVDRRRQAGEGFDRLARAMKVSRGMVVRACDFADRDEAATAAREGRLPPRPPYKGSEQSRAARRKPRV